MVDVILIFISWLAKVMLISILIRILMSWIMPQDSSSVSRVLADITEPILAPIRRVLPPAGGMDFSPMVATILIYVFLHFLVTPV